MLLNYSSVLHQELFLNDINHKGLGSNRSLKHLAFKVQSAGLRHDPERLIKSILIIRIITVETYSLHSPERFLLAESFEIDLYLLRLVRYIDHLHIYPSIVRIIHRARKKPHLSVCTGDVDSIHIGELQDIGTAVLSIEFLNIPAARTEATQIVEPYQIRSPLPAFDMGEQRSI